MGDDKRQGPGRRAGDRRSGKDTRTETEKRAVGDRRSGDRRSGIDRRTGKPVVPPGSRDKT